MKKILSMIIAGLFLVSTQSLNAVTLDGTDSNSTSQQVSHSVAAISAANFVINQGTGLSKTRADNDNTTIPVFTSGELSLGDLYITNNTQNGYKVQISATNGILMPSGSSSGESNISYDIVATDQKALLPQIDANLGIESSFANGKTFSQSDAGNTLDVLTVSGVTSETKNLHINFKMQIDSVNEKLLKLAGTYRESFTIYFVDNAGAI